MDNRGIAERLDAFATLLELSEANSYTIRAYRRAAETIRGTAVPVAELVRTGHVRRLRGVGSGIEARLQELVETGEIAELAELERELSPELVGLGRYLGLSAQRSIDLARALGIRTADELREAAAAGRLRDVPGIGEKTEARLLGALAREPEEAPARGLLLNRARELVGGIAEAVASTKAQVVYVCNLRGEVCETEGYDVADHVAALARHNVQVDVVLCDSIRGMEIGVTEAPVRAVPLTGENTLVHSPAKLAQALSGLLA